MPVSAGADCRSPRCMPAASTAANTARRSSAMLRRRRFRRRWQQGGGCGRKMRADRAGRAQLSVGARFPRSARTLRCVLDKEIKALVIRASAGSRVYDSLGPDAARSLAARVGGGWPIPHPKGVRPDSRAASSSLSRTSSWPIPGT
eukprot:366513-Chlamydomonas_euryale.AAC.4